MHQISDAMQGHANAPTDPQLLGSLGQRLAEERLRRNWTQSHLASEAGVSRATVQRLEQGESTQLTNLVRILRALDLARNLDALVPATPVSPLQMVHHGRKQRQRASSPGPTPPPGPWQWGEDK